MCGCFWFCSQNKIIIDLDLKFSVLYSIVAKKVWLFCTFFFVLVGETRICIEFCLKLWTCLYVCISERWDISTQKLNILNFCTWNDKERSELFRNPRTRDRKWRLGSHVLPIAQARTCYVTIVQVERWTEERGSQLLLICVCLIEAVSCLTSWNSHFSKRVWNIYMAMGWSTGQRARHIFQIL